MLLYIKRKVIELICIAPLIYLGFVAWLIIHQDANLFPGATKTRSDRAPALPESFKPVEFTTADGIKLSAFAAEPNPNVPEAAWCLYCEGQGGRARWDLPKFQLFQNLGLGVLTVDYRGYGLSKGSPSEEGLYRDADAAYNYLIKVKGVKPHRVVVYGHSLGSGVAIDLASRVQVGALIVDGAYTSVPDVVQENYSWLPLAWVAKNHFETLNKIAKVTAPKLFLHGEFDESIPWQEGRKVFDKATGPKVWSRFEGGHEDFPWSASVEFHASVSKFMGQYMPAPAPDVKPPALLPPAAAPAAK